MFIKKISKCSTFFLSKAFSIFSIFAFLITALVLYQYKLEDTEINAPIYVDYQIQYGCFYTGNQTPSYLIGTYEFKPTVDHSRGYVGLPITEFSFGGYFVLPFTEGCCLKMQTDKQETNSGLYCDQMVNVPFYQTNITKISANHFRIKAFPNGHGRLPWKMY